MANSGKPETASPPSLPQTSATWQRRDTWGLRLTPQEEHALELARHGHLPRNGWGLPLDPPTECLSPALLSACQRAASAALAAASAGEGADTDG